jgi:hypothetical protein
VWQCGISAAKKWLALKITPSGVCVCVCVCVWASEEERVQLSMQHDRKSYVCMYVCTCVRMYAYIACMYVCMYVCTCMQTASQRTLTWPVYMNVCMHVYRHPDCNTNNIYITSQQDLIISYCRSNPSEVDDQGSGMICEWVCICMYVYVYVYVYVTCTYTHAHVHARECMFAHTHTHTHGNSLINARRL